MEVFYENLIVYAGSLLLVILIIYLYIKREKRKSSDTIAKIKKAIRLGFHEPVSLHPVINPDTCIGSGACIAACPEKDILGMVGGQAKVINASRCVGHGACFHACPMNAITLNMGTEKRGVELPHVSKEFETNVPGIYIAGELGGMGLIRNAVEQGKQAVEYFSKSLAKKTSSDFDLIIVGAGPAGIAATLTAEKNKLKYLTIEQDSLGGTIYNFPRAKIVMTSPMYLPLYGNVKLKQTSKTELLNMWERVLTDHSISINEHEKVEGIKKENEKFIVTTNNSVYTTKGIILAIGRRGTPRKLGISGENKEKVFYRLLEPELIHNNHIIVVGGGDSAIEAALLLADEENTVSLSYRGNSFSRLKPINLEKINDAVESGKIKIFFRSNLTEILDTEVIIKTEDNEQLIRLKNDLVYIFAGGELPTSFLEKIGIKITKKFGEAVLKH